MWEECLALAWKETGSERRLHDKRREGLGETQDARVGWSRAVRRASGRTYGLSATVSSSAPRLAPAGPARRRCGDKGGRLSPFMRRRRDAAAAGDDRAVELHLPPRPLERSVDAESGLTARS